MTLSLRARLAGISGALFGVLLVGLSVSSYAILSRTLDRDATERLIDLTEGLHGYLRFEPEAVSLHFDASDDDEATFVHEAARYYQVYDAASGGLLAQSPALAPLGVEFTPRHSPGVSHVRALLQPLGWMSGHSLHRRRATTPADNAM